jgi:DNA-binding transcriptional ArsR family regulator
MGLPETVTIDDPAAMAALSHPLRLRIIRVLRERGPGTATSVARTLGETSGATSYHLRQLARYELVLPDERHSGSGRERWWRARARHFEFATGAAGSPEQESASRRLRHHLIQRDNKIIADYLEHEDQFEPDWRDAAVFSNESLYLTPAELEDARVSLHAQFEPYLSRTAHDHPAQARRVHITLRAVPTRTEGADQ